MSPRTSLVCLLVLGTTLAPSISAAQEQNTEAAATALFDEGLKLMQAKKYADACPKLAESERLAPSGGTLLNLADCYEHTGQTASAWVAWKDAAARADAAGKTDAEKRALARAAALEPNLAKLTISVDAASDVPGLEVKRDGVPVGHASFGVAFPVDPGPHEIDATAPNKNPFSASVTVAPKQTNAIVTVTLVDAPQAAAPPAPTPAPAPAPAAPPPDQPPPSSWSAQKTIALVVGGVGVAGVAVGAIFGVMAMSKNNQALQSSNCPTSTECDSNGLSLTNTAKSDATVSTVGFIAGGVLVAAGAVLWITAPSAHPTTGVRVTPLVGLGTGGLALDAKW
jgi:hypothetical protein